MEYLCASYAFLSCSRAYSALDHVIRYRLSPACLETSQINDERNYPMLRKTVLTIIFISAAVSSLRAQSTFGTIVGVVQDQTQAFIPDVQIEARNLDDNTARSTKSAPDGSFQLLNLRPGRYQVVAAKEEFAPFKIAALQVDARQTVRAD